MLKFLDSHFPRMILMCVFATRLRYFPSLIIMVKVVANLVVKIGLRFIQNQVLPISELRFYPRYIGVEKKGSTTFGKIQTVAPVARHIVPMVIADNYFC